MSQCKRQMNQKKGRAAGRRKSVLIAFSFILVIGCTVIFGGFFSSAHGSRSTEPVNFKYYKSIQVKNGDTLWSIANEYMTDDYDNAKDYMKELVELNALDSKTSRMLKDGEYLLVAYNDTEFR